MGTHLQSLKSNLQISNLAIFSSRSEYDRSVNSFSPEGRLFQVEYAIDAIKLGSTAVGIQTAEGVVLVVEKRITSKLIEPSSIEKVFDRRARRLCDERVDCGCAHDDRQGQG